MSEEPIVRYTAEELAEKRKRGETQTEWERLEAMTEEELEASIAADPDSEVPPEVWDHVTMGLPDVMEPKKHINFRLDADVWRWFKATGRGYQTRMNAVLRSYVQAQKAKEDAVREARENRSQV